MPSLRQRCGSDKHGTRRGLSGHQLLHLGPYPHLVLSRIKLGAPGPLHQAGYTSPVNSTPPPTSNPPTPLILFFHISLWLLNGKSKIIHPWELFTSTTVRKPAGRLDTLLGKSGVWNGESKVFQTKRTSQSLSGRFSLTQNHLRHQVNFIWGRWTFLSPWDEQPQG